MSFQTINVQKKNSVARITLNRPQAMNAINLDVVTELREALLDIKKDDGIRVVVITGAGKAFCAGADLKAGPEGVGKIVSQGKKTYQAIEDLDRPVIAAVNGYCITGGMELAMSCDIIIASENAIFWDTHGRVGAVPGWGGSQRLPRIVGIMKAKEMFFASEPITAREAERLGLVNHVVPAEQLDAAVQEMSDKIIANSGAAVAWMKSLVNQGSRLNLDAALRLEPDMEIATPDAPERMRAFREGRLPKPSPRR
ncbi:MAG: enoyl-CoA hydratase/isomerase family protein [Dehalococcoidia bacterium]|nr:enoyl-CoA hydratase/isomerase family protein [Dehalococcoidia bacterium]